MKNENGQLINKYFKADCERTSKSLPKDLLLGEAQWEHDGRLRSKLSRLGGLKKGPGKH